MMSDPCASVPSHEDGARRPLLDSRLARAIGPATRPTGQQASRPEQADSKTEARAAITAGQSLRLRVIPTFGPVGYWRLQITTAVNLRDGVNLPFRDDSAVFGLSAGGFPSVGSLEVSAATTVDEVAEEFLRCLGSPRAETYFNDDEYCLWFAAMRRQADELDSPPAAFSDEHSGWRCAGVDITPPPGWVTER